MVLGRLPGCLSSRDALDFSKDALKFSKDACHSVRFVCTELNAAMNLLSEFALFIFSEFFCTPWGRAR